MNWEEYSCSLSCLGCEEQKCAIDHANRSELGVLLHNMKNNVFDIKPYPSAARNSEFTKSEKCSTGNNSSSIHFQQIMTTPISNKQLLLLVKTKTTVIRLNRGQQYPLQLLLLNDRNLQLVETRVRTNLVRQ